MSDVMKTASFAGGEIPGTLFACITVSKASLKRYLLETWFMNKKTVMFQYPPLSMNDVAILNGEPALKKVENSADNGQCMEEWLYINNESHEHFYFNNNMLVNYKRINLR